MGRINRFDEIVNQRIKDAKLTDQRINEKKNKLLQLSLNYDGLDISEYLSSSSVKVCEQFLSFMGKYDYPLATELRLIMPTKLKPLSVIERHRLLNQPSKRIKHLQGFRELWHGRGYNIGAIFAKYQLYPVEKNGCNVYLCTDHKLRSKRNLPIFNDGSSYTAGVGSAPVKKLFGENVFFETGDYSASGPNDINYFKSLDVGVIFEQYVRRTDIYQLNSGN